MKLTFKIWRQEGPNTKGMLKDYEIADLTEDMSFLEALDHLNEIFKEGTGADKQLQVYEQTGDLKAVVDLIHSSFLESC